MLCGIAQKANARSAWYPNCLYVSGFAGPAWHREMDIQFSDPTGVNPTYDLITDYRTGYGVGGAIGAVFCRNWRLEVEAYFRNLNGKRVVATQRTNITAFNCCDTGALYCHCLT